MICICTDEIIIVTRNIYYGCICLYVPYMPQSVQMHVTVCELHCMSLLAKAQVFRAVAVDAVPAGECDSYTYIAH